MGETRLGPSAQPFLSLMRSGDDAPIVDGAVRDDGLVFGTYLHGLFDSNSGADALLSHLRRMCERSQNLKASNPINLREQHYDELAAHFRRYLDMNAVYEMLGSAQ